MTPLSQHTNQCQLSQNLGLDIDVDYQIKVIPTSLYNSSTDPIIQLPPELIQIIFGYLSFKDLLRCLSVSRTWNYVLSNQSCIWINHVDIRHIHYDFCAHIITPSPESFIKYLSLGIQYSKGEEQISITEVDLNLCSNNVIYTMAIANTTNTRQNRIFVNQPSCLGERFFSMYVPTNAAQTNLTKISINVPLIECSVFMDLLESFPLLESVIISDFRFVGFIPKRSNDYQFNNNNIRELTLQRTECGFSAEDEFLGLILQGLHNLEFLDMSLVHRQELVEVISNMTTLKRLLLRFLQQSQVTLPALNCPNLEELVLRAWSLNIDSSSPPFTKLLNLKAIDVICDSYSQGSTFLSLLDYYGCWSTIESLQLISSRFWNKQELKSICRLTPNLQQITLQCKDVELSDIFEIADMSPNICLVNVSPRYEMTDNQQLGYSEYRKNHWIQKSILNMAILFERQDNVRRNTV